VFIPTLTGLGERSHLLTKDVDLDTHIADVVNLFEWESLESVCLVVHAYAGFVGSAALEAIGNRVSAIVWLDAFVPSDGQKVLDFANEAFRNLGEAGFAPPTKIPAIFVAERDQSFVESKLTPQPIATYLQPIKLAGALEKVAKKTYVPVAKFPQPAFDKALADCKNDKSWAAFVMSDVGHMAMLDAPDDVSELIVQVA
jgi:alpha/beta hydrolase family protein